VLPARALLDAWSLAPPERRKSIFYESLWARATSVLAVARELRDVPRLRGRRALEALLKHFADGAMSPIEVFARTEVFVGSRWSEFELQAPLPGGYAADMLHAATKVVVELDGRRYHGRADRAERDRIRDAEVARFGYLTVRLSPRDLADRPEWCRNVVAGAVASRRGL
jgi:very-short-patch-repair endonuclease